ncbi:MAG: transcription elongation factor GreA [Patescibacteria group bacterium]|nr:transcription elongation factor GreA [Patescibacteria group bacterium]MDE2437884.1 transcription elongation factor GreA [Patescibacteria group bacterium]
MKNYYVTKERLVELKQQLEELKKVKRLEIARRLEHAKELGDLSENAEYSEARDAQTELETQIAELEDLIKNASIIERHKAHAVEIGSLVSVSSNRTQKKVTIVGSDEADPVNNKISNESPMGKAFLGKKIGDVVEITTPAGKTKYTIDAIE